ncbi:MAG: hypothetical protein LBH22_01285 [Bacteroidales bacterium]|jgi:hypothetical protein|nr:hypothetical protein [Bacteroidales bacterium]
MKKEIKLQQRILEFVRLSKNKKTGNDFISLGVITNSQARYLKKHLGIVVFGYERILSLKGIRHAINGHKNLKENDFLAILFIVECPDVVTLGNKPNTIVYRKDLDNCYVYVECVQKRQKRLEIKTFYKTKKPPKKN